MTALTASAAVGNRSRKEKWYECPWCHLRFRAFLKPGVCPNPSCGFARVAFFGYV